MFSIVLSFVDSNHFFVYLFIHSFSHLFVSFLFYSQFGLNFQLSSFVRPPFAILLIMFESLARDTMWSHSSSDRKFGISKHNKKKHTCVFFLFICKRSFFCNFLSLRYECVCKHGLYVPGP